MTSALYFIHIVTFYVVLIFLLFINFDHLDILALVDAVDSCVFRASIPIIPTRGIKTTKSTVGDLK